MSSLEETLEAIFKSLLREGYETGYIQMAIMLSDKSMSALRQVTQHKADLRFARRIRRFRPQPVAEVSDRELAEIVRISREAARSLGIKRDQLIARFVMIDALIAPKFYEREEFQHHFNQASGDPDIKLGDMFRLLRLTMMRNGRVSEVWWS